MRNSALFCVRVGGCISFLAFAQYNRKSLGDALRNQFLFPHCLTSEYTNVQAHTHTHTHTCPTRIKPSREESCIWGAAWSVVYLKPEGPQLVKRLKVWKERNTLFIINILDFSFCFEFYLFGISLLQINCSAENSVSGAEMRRKEESKYVKILIFLYLQTFILHRRHQWGILASCKNS